MTKKALKVFTSIALSLAVAFILVAKKITSIFYTKTHFLKEI